MSNEHYEFLKAIKRRRALVLISQLLILAGFLMLWEVAATLKWVDPFIFSQPSRIAKALFAMSADGSIFIHLGVTLYETALGFVLSTVFGTLIAIFLWWNAFAERVANPYLVVLNSLPKTALAPIIIVWMGNNTKSIIVTAVMTSIIVTIITVLTGFTQVDKEKLKLIQTLGGTKSQALTKVVLPASVPSFIAAIKINVGLSFVGVIVGEFLVAKRGLGYLIVYGSQIFKMDWVMLSIILLCILAALMYNGVVVLEKKFNQWN